MRARSESASTAAGIPASDPGVSARERLGKARMKATARAAAIHELLQPVSLAIRRLEVFVRLPDMMASLLQD
jgi:hypothetical protein